jgi:riboflavin synthase
VSLTVNRVDDFLGDHGPQGHDALRGSEISINLIPHTVENTALGSLQSGSTVNLEIDTVARYVERMLRVDATLAAPTSLKAHP